MRPARTRRALVAAVSLTAALAVAAPVAQAEPAPAPHSETAQNESPQFDLASLLPTNGETPDVDERILQSLGAFAPALIGSAATRDADGEVDEALLADARKLADNPLLPAQVQATWNTLIDFLGEPGKEEAAKVAAAEKQPAAKQEVEKKKEGAPDIPTGPNKPRIQEFLYPTIGIGCMPGGNSVGMALTTAGPQEAPAPGPKRGEAGFVYTSLGTGPALTNKNQPLYVSWLNLDTGKTGQAKLLPNPKINADSGPATFTAVVKTGKGRIVSTIHGNATSKTKGKYASCTIVPTIGTAII